MTTAQKISLPILFLLSSALLVNPALAQDSGLSVSAIPPRVQDILVKPGQVITKEIKVRNESDVEKFVNTTIKDFIVKDDKGTPIQIDTTKNDSRWAASSWIQVSPTRLRLKPGETKSLMMTVITPENALPGGHYAMVVHSPSNDSFLKGTGAAVETNVGSLVYITVDGKVKQNAQILNFLGPGFQEYGPVDFKTVINNLSDVHITPAGSITVKNWLGVKTAVMPLENLNIFPYTNREFNNTLNKRWLFGRYQANLNAAYGTAGGLLSATLSFWVIPWRLLILVLAFFVTIAALVMVNKHPKSKTEGKIEELEKELEDLKNKYKDRK